MLKHILYLYQRPSLRSEMALNSRKYVQKHFLWERNINVLINLIENRVPAYEEMGPVETREKAEVL
jgi:glycosyltransferase involved in cell wall biosynthesis